MVSFDKDKLANLLESLKELPKIKEVRALQNRIQKELVRIKTKKKVTRVPSKEKIAAQANVKRSSSMKKNWRFWKLIADATGLKVSEVRKQWKKRKEGFEVDIPDAIWQNPSA